eukprot:7357273-Prymnesium_polylepis.1
MRPPVRRTVIIGHYQLGAGVGHYSYCRAVGKKAGWAPALTHRPFLSYLAVSRTQRNLLFSTWS